MIKTQTTGRRLVDFQGFVVGALIAGLLAAPAMLWAYEPSDPAVQKILAPAVAYLENPDTKHFDIGGNCLIALALYKTGKKTDHPKIAATLTQCKALARSGSIDRFTEMYSPGLVLYALGELNGQDNKAEMASLLRAIVARQKVHGGWGYSNESEPRGDTSQSQYCVLGMWGADRWGVQGAIEPAAKVCNWFIRVQDPSGAWGYQGVDTGTVGARVPQEQVRHSLTAASLSSVYICADMLGFTDLVEGSSEESANRDSEYPPDVRIVLDQVDVPGGDKKGPRTKAVNPAALTQTMNLGDRWFARNGRPNPTPWTFYYLYALERYHAFREIATGQAVKSPKWYNDGVEFLRATQKNFGGWQSQDTEQAIDTSFAVLFLTRGTQQTVGKPTVSEGLYKGGQGLPAEGDLRVVDGKIVSSGISRSVGELMSIIKNAEEGDLMELIKSTESLEFDEGATSREKQVTTLRMLVSHENYAARMVAIKTMSKTRDLDNVPTLIYALTDPDWRVAKAARDGLRFVSRKFNGLGVDDPPKGTDNAERLAEWAKAAQEKWQAWYLSVKPDARFIGLQGG